MLFIARERKKTPLLHLSFFINRISFFNNRKSLTEKRVPLSCNAHRLILLSIPNSRPTYCRLHTVQLTDEVFCFPLSQAPRGLVGPLANDSTLQLFSLAWPALLCSARLFGGKIVPWPSGPQCFEPVCPYGNSLIIVVGQDGVRCCQRVHWLAMKGRDPT